MNGRCLCGEVQFELKGKTPHLYQCHCSQCRKVTGSSSNAATFVEKANFKWIAGEQVITSYSKDGGYRSDFCSRCGSPVPNQLRGMDKYWVPAGSIEGYDDFRVIAHLHIGSKAEWEEIGGSGVRYEGMPNIDTLNKALQRTSR